MSMEVSLSIQAITLAKAVFESVHGNLGLLRFNIEELTPTNGDNGENSKKWKIICSFFETLGSTSPTRYEVNVNLNDNTVSIKKLGIEGDEKKKEYRIEPKEDNLEETEAKE